MTTTRDLMSAWLLVAALGAVLVLGWGAAGPRTADVAACLEPAALATVEAPRSGGWQPDAVLAGVDDESPAMTSYEVSEARNLARIEATAVPDVRVAYGSSTSLNPTRMC